MNLKKKVIVSAAAHDAVNHLLDNFVKQGVGHDIVRLGPIERIPSRHHQYNPKEKLLREGYSRKNRNLPTYVKDAIKLAEIVLGTPVSVKGSTAKTVVLDEGGQCTEQNTMCLINKDLEIFISLGWRS